MPRKTKKAEEVPHQPPVSNEFVAEGAEQFTSPAQTSFSVVLPDGGTVRTYSVPEQASTSEEAKAKAEAFARKVGGTVI